MIALEVFLGIVLSYFFIKQYEKGENPISKILKGASGILLLIAIISVIIGSIFGILYGIAYMTNNNNPTKGFKTNLEVYIFILAFWAIDKATLKILKASKILKGDPKVSFFAAGFESFVAIYIFMIPILLVTFGISYFTGMINSEYSDSIYLGAIGFSIALGFIRHFLVRADKCPKFLLPGNTKSGHLTSCDGEDKQDIA